MAADNKIFYLPQYKKFFEIIWINGVDNIVGLYNRHHDAAGVQNGLMRAGHGTISLCQSQTMEG